MRCAPSLLIASLAWGCALPHPGSPDHDAATDTSMNVDGRVGPDVTDVPALDVADTTLPDVVEEPRCPGAQVECSGVCTDLLSDTNHCGSCSTQCTPGANQQASCSMGVCVAGPCSTGYSDCDDNPSNGCETMGTCPIASCAALATGAPSGVYRIGSIASNWSAYCENAADGGGWTLVLKADGTQQTFTYDAPLWTSTTTLNTTSTNLDRVEAKFDGFSTLAVHAIRVAMYDTSDMMVRSVVLNVTATSLQSVFASGTHVASSLGRTGWEALMRTGSLQTNCLTEGLNNQPSPGGSGSEVRIGIIGNDQNDCSSPNSRIGVGGAGATTSVCNPAGAATLTVGDEAGCTPDNGNVSTPGFAYVFVR